MTDYELVKNKDYTAIMKKYRPLMMRYFQKMLTVSNCGFEDFEDFIGGFYEDMVKAIDAVKPSKIKDPETFGLYQQLAFYLQNFTTRKISKSIRDKKFNAQIEEGYDAPYSDQTNENVERQESFDTIYTKLLDDTQRESYELFLRGVPAYKLPVGSRGWAKILQIFKENLDV